MVRHFIFAGFVELRLLRTCQVVDVAVAKTDLCKQTGKIHYTVVVPVDVAARKLILGNARQLLGSVLPVLSEAMAYPA